MQRSDRLARGTAWSLGSGAIPLFVGSFLGLPLGLVWLTGFFGGLVAAVMAGDRLLTRLVYVAPGLFGPLAIFIASAWYVGSETTFSELVIPVGIGSVPALLVWWGFGSVLARWELPAK